MSYFAIKTLSSLSSYFTNDERLDTRPNHVGVGTVSPSDGLIQAKLFISSDRVKGHVHGHASVYHYILLANIAHLSIAFCRIMRKALIKSSEFENAKGMRLCM